MLNIFQKARKEKYAVGAFNVSNLEQLKAIIQAAVKLKSPVIIATSQGEGKFLGWKQIRALTDAHKEESSLPLILHLDHGKSLSVIEKAIAAGYDSIHFDGSELDLKENMAATKKVVELARQHGVKNVEGELGYLPGESTVHEAVQIKEENLTPVQQVAEFIQTTGVDSLAVAVGNIHGICRGKRMENPSLHLDRLKEIQKKAGAVSLVLHGGSGTPEADIKAAFNLGVVKINVNTELRTAYTVALKKSLRENPRQTTPYKIMPPVVEAVQKVVESKIKLFGSRDKL